MSHIQVNGTTSNPNTVVTVHFGACTEPAQGTATSGSDRTFSISVTVPEQATTAIHVKDTSDNHCQFAGNYTHSDPRPKLPNTLKLSAAAGDFDGDEMLTTADLNLFDEFLGYKSLVEVNGFQLTAEEVNSCDVNGSKSCTGADKTAAIIWVTNYSTSIVRCPGYVPPTDSSPFGGGDGSTSNPYVLCLKSQLDSLMTDSWRTKNFILSASIDVGGAEINTWKVASLDGRSYSISNIVNTETYSHTNSGVAIASTVKNLKLRNVTLRSSRQGGFACVIAANRIENVHVVGGEIDGVSGASGLSCGLGYWSSEKLIVSRSSSETNVYSSDGLAGGLVWAIEGTYAHGDTEISDSYFNGHVMAKKAAGGIIGHLGKGKILRSYALGEIRAVSTDSNFGLAGGLAGSAFPNNTAILDSFSDTKVNGDQASGGILGDSRSGAVRVENALAFGQLLGIRKGGIVGGYRSSSNPINSFFNSTLNPVTEDPQFGKSTEQMDNYRLNLQSFFITWDYVNAWRKGDIYPSLRY